MARVALRPGEDAVCLALLDAAFPPPHMAHQRTHPIGFAMALAYAAGLLLIFFGARRVDTT